MMDKINRPPLQCTVRRSDRTGEAFISVKSAS